MKRYLIVILAFLLMSSSAFAQDSVSAQSDPPPRDLGLFIHFGFAKSSVSDLNDILGEFGYAKADEYRLAGGLAYNYLETELFSHELVLNLVAVETLEAEVESDGASKIKQYGFSLMISLNP